MKSSRLVIYILIVLVITFLVTTCIFYKKSYEYKTQFDDLQSKINKEKEQNLLEENQEKIILSNLEEKLSNNDIPIGLYTKQNGKLVLAKEIYCDWSMESIFSVFYTVASNEEEIVCENYKLVFNEYWNKNINASNCKIGYSIKYSLDSGEIIDKNVMNPTEAESLFSKLQFYLYDDVTDMGSRKYYHMREYEMTDNTLLTSVKICGDKETPEINGPIELTAFVYENDDEFDLETGKYIGNNKFTTKIYRERYK